MGEHIIVATAYDNNLYWRVYVATEDLILLHEEFRKYARWIEKLDKGLAPRGSYADQDFANNRYIISQRYPRTYSRITCSYEPLDISLTLVPIEEIKEEVEFENGFDDLIAFIENPFFQDNIISIGYRVLPTTRKVIEDNLY